MMNLLDAFHRTVLDYPGGAQSLAPRLGMSVAILRNKANPNINTNFATLQDLDNLLAVTEDYRALHALAANHNHVCYQVDPDATASDMAVLELVTAVWVKNGSVGAAVNDALADGRIDKKEIDQIKDAVYKLHQATLEMLGRLESMSEK